MPSIKSGTMTISVSKNMLLAKLQQLSRIIPSKPTTPIVCNYLFDIKDGRLFITAANDEGRITASLECMAEEDLSICVPASILDGLKTLPEQPLDIYINPDNKSILIKYHGGKFEVVGYDSKPFPQKKKTEVLDEIRTTAEEFNNGISKVINFAAADELRPVMNSVSIETVPGEIIFVSSNGHGLGLFKRENKRCTETCSVIISRQIASVLKGL
ncbi:DNA polymerase III subunit beta, partial [Parabacteroides sp. N37]|nr:DNA polymerase III subunit beta [Parabacteroides hominis]